MNCKQAILRLVIISLQSSMCLENPILFKLVWISLSDLWNWPASPTPRTKTTCDQRSIIFEPPHDKTNTMTVRPAKTQISLDVRPIWSEPSLSAWRKVGSLATHWVLSKDWSEIFSWPSLHERMCQMWGSNSGPLACQVDMFPMGLLRPAE